MCHGFGTNVQIEEEAFFVQSFLFLFFLEGTRKVLKVWMGWQRSEYSILHLLAKSWFLSNIDRSLVAFLWKLNWWQVQAFLGRSSNYAQIYLAKFVPNSRITSKHPTLVHCILTNFLFDPDELKDKKDEYLMATTQKLLKITQQGERKKRLMNNSLLNCVYKSQI